MSTVVQALHKRNDAWITGLVGATVLVIAAVATPNLLRTRDAADKARKYAMRERLRQTYQTDPYQASPSETATFVGRVTPTDTVAAKIGLDSSADRKLVRTSAIDLVVQRPAEAAERIRALAERMGGFLVSSEVRGGTDAAFGSLTIRVPASRFEEARQEIRKLGLRVESEKVEAQDVTRQYVDQEASLRNLRAEETQYLSILKRAATVKDTLEVSEKLSVVRGQIEQQQAEHEALAKQVETVAITVSLSAEAEAQVFGLHWRPLYQAKLALRQGLEALADYVATMTSVVFYLPTVLLWLVTILVGAAVGWRVLRRVARLLFGWPKAVVASEGAR